MYDRGELTDGRELAGDQIGAIIGIIINKKKTSFKIYNTDIVGTIIHTFPKYRTHQDIFVLTCLMCVCVCFFIFVFTSRLEAADLKLIL